jgi:hypothetical protein
VIARDSLYVSGQYFNGAQKGTLVERLDLATGAVDLSFMSPAPWAGRELLVNFGSVLAVDRYDSAADLNMTVVPLDPVTGAATNF